MAQNKMQLKPEQTQQILLDLDESRKCLTLNNIPDGEFGFTIVCKTDIRADLFSTIVQNGLILLELSPYKDDLESVFHRLTEGEQMPFIVGTAGHIDHGKTSLVRALTGIDLDSSPEEKERGITIALGFTSLHMDGVEYSFIDVPGHERLIRTMIAGATGLDAVMLCVSATDSVMPQTVEHLNILNLLGVQAGLIAITMCDLADEEDIELITEEIEELVAGTFLEGAPIIQTSTEGEGFGQNTICTHLQQVESVRTVHQHNRPFRLPC